MKKISMLMMCLIMMLSGTCLAKNLQSAGFVNGRTFYTDQDAIYGEKGPEGQELLTAVAIVAGNKLTEVHIYQFDLTNNMSRELYGAGYTKKGSREYESTNSPELAPNRGWKALEASQSLRTQLLDFCRQHAAAVQHKSGLGTVESIEDGLKKFSTAISNSFGQNKDNLITQGVALQQAVDNAQRNAGYEQDDKVIYEILGLQGKRVGCIVSGLQGDTSAFGEGNAYYSDCKNKINKLRMSTAGQYATNN